ncbi:response regulator [Bdellovibrio sp. HCB288]|uniref:response regulator n=1 Tax=Bdellovibrio sp. HCB288 TaxID=3394355 RepID=UPI0039B53959
MVQRTLDFDWASTDLGPIESWDFGLINSLRILFNCPVGMYCTWGPERRVFYNDAYIPILKHRHPKALGSQLHDVWPEVWDQVEEIASTVDSGGTVLAADVQFDIEVEGEGKPRDNYYTYGNSPLFNAKGEIAGMLCTILDTTVSVIRNHTTEENLAKTIRELQAAKMTAENANLAKSAFLANMSHEIRTPLGVILGFSEIIGTQDLEAEERDQYFDVIQRNGASLTRIIDDILDLSKIEAGKFELEKSPVSIRSLTEEVLGMYSDQASKKNIQIKSDLEEIRDLVVITDSVRIRQVLLNLVGNAVKFTSTGSVSIFCRVSQKAGNQKEITFQIEDTGIGMTQEQSDRLFQPFTQADATSTRRFGGTGLGLALSKNLAHTLNGDVRIVNCVTGKGCIFEFSFQADVTNMLPQPSSPQIEQNTADTSLEGFKVLAVDDSPDNQELIQTILSHVGLDVTEVRSGEEAIKEAFHHNYDLVLMDIQMPGLDGFGTLSELRSRGFKAPIIALTAHAMKEDRDRALAAGFADHVTKPINTHALVQTIRSYLNKPRLS